MNRIEIETKLNRDRAWLLDAFSQMPEEDLWRGVTESEHDPSKTWTPKDHLVHLARIEFNFAAMIRKHIEGHANPVGLRQDDSGRERSREEIMASVHAMTEAWAERHRAKSLSEVVAVGQAARAETFKLLGELSDEQLAATLPGAPWADGTIGGVLAANADHGRMHWRWMREGFERNGLVPPSEPVA